MAEWSKAVDLRSSGTSFRVGSNPTSCSGFLFCQGRESFVLAEKSSLTTLVFANNYDCITSKEVIMR